MAEPRRVVLAEDDGAVRSAVADYLQSAGFEVVQTANGAEAINAARSGSPDLLILDLEMPVMSGRQVLEAWRGDESLRRTPIVLISGAADLTAAAHEYGVRATLAKPFDLDVLTAVVEQVLAHPEPPPDSETIAG